MQEMSKQMKNNESNGRAQSSSECTKGGANRGVVSGKTFLPLYNEEWQEVEENIENKIIIRR